MTPMQVSQAFAAPSAWRPADACPQSAAQTGGAPAAVQSLDLSHPGASQAQLVQVVRALAGARHATPRLPAIADALAAAARGGLAPWPPRRATGLLHAFALLNFSPSRLLASSDFPPSRLLTSSKTGGGDGEGGA